jgi:AcrR family transcriptional regulator
VSDLRTKILETAYQQFQKGGYESVTLRSIAKELGVTHPALYTYFRSKEELFALLRLDVLNQLKAQLFSGINPHGTFRQIIGQVADNFFQYFATRRPHFKILFLLDSNGDSKEVQLQILEYIDQLLILPEHNINMPQIFWYALMGHAYAWYTGEVTQKKATELIAELANRLAQSQ